MSFSQNVKCELAENINLCKRICIYGILVFTDFFSSNAYTFSTENEHVAKMFRDGLCELLIDNDDSQLKIIDNNNVFHISICKEIQNQIMDQYGTLSDSASINANIIKEEFSAFVAGAFLACGNMEDPLKGYYLEFRIDNYLLCMDFMRILQESDIRVKYIERHKKHILYINASESIEDLLTTMGAIKSTIELMNIKILKDIRNKTNRIVNCDTANVNRTLKAARKQIEDIEYIIMSNEFDNLSPELRSLSELRLENPDLSLKELGELLEKPLSRHGVNNRFIKISRIAQDLRENH